jgi:23S rRNA pseudouridine2605 synthase
MTLDRVLSRCGAMSRSDARRAIAAGRMKVNGRVVRDADCWVHADRARFHFDGRPLRRAKGLYVLLYKPKGVITSHRDPEGRRTVYDLLDPGLGWLVPVGRLDMDSSGLLLMTNDTDFASFVMEPASRVLKTYLVKLNGLVGNEVLESVRSGVRMKRGDWARPESVRLLEDRGRCSRLEVVLAEGKNREVRRMMEAVGFQVLKLVRTRIGHLTLDGLEIGKWRKLTPAEVARFGHRKDSQRASRARGDSLGIPGQADSG